MGEGAESSFPELTTSRMTLQGPSECDPRRLDLDFSSAGDFFSFFFCRAFCHSFVFLHFFLTDFFFVYFIPFLYFFNFV